MRVIDYNGEGIWSRGAILERYSLYCCNLKIRESDLSPTKVVHEDVTWIYPVMHKIIDGIENRDPACKLIGIEFIETDERFTFGKILKSNTARALRRSILTEAEKERIRKRIIDMLLHGNVPHEFKQYFRLLKTIGLGNHKDEIERGIDRSNPYVMKYYGKL